MSGKSRIQAYGFRYPSLQVSCYHDTYKVLERVGCGLGIYLNLTEPLVNGFFESDYKKSLKIARIFGRVGGSQNHQRVMRDLQVFFKTGLLPDYILEPYYRSICGHGTADEVREILRDQYGIT